MGPSVGRYNYGEGDVVTHPDFAELALCSDEKLQRLGDLALRLSDVDLDAPKNVHNPEYLEGMQRSKEFDMLRPVLEAEQDLLHGGEVSKATDRRNIMDFSTLATEDMDDRFVVEFALKLEEGYLVAEDGSTLDWSLVQGLKEAEKRAAADEAMQSHADRALYDLGELDLIYKMLNGELLDDDGNVANQYWAMSGFSHDVLSKYGSAGKAALDNAGYMTDRKVGIGREFTMVDKQTVHVRVSSYDGSDDAALHAIYGEIGKPIEATVSGEEFLAHGIARRTQPGEQSTDEYIMQRYDELLTARDGVEYKQGKQLVPGDVLVDAWNFIMQRNDLLVPFITFVNELAELRVAVQKEQRLAMGEYMQGELEYVLTARDNTGDFLINTQNRALAAIVMDSPEMVADDDVAEGLMKIITQIRASDIKRAFREAKATAPAQFLHQDTEEEVPQGGGGGIDIDDEMLNGLFDTVSDRAQDFGQDSRAQNATRSQQLRSNRDSKERGEKTTGCGGSLDAFGVGELIGEQLSSIFGGESSGDQDGGTESVGEILKKVFEKKNKKNKKSKKWFGEKKFFNQDCRSCEIPKAVVGECRVCQSCTSMFDRGMSLEQIRRAVGAEEGVANEEDGSTDYKDSYETAQQAPPQSLGASEDTAASVAPAADGTAATQNQVIERQLAPQR